jgi:DNA-binding phage protein
MGKWRKAKDYQENEIPLPQLIHETEMEIRQVICNAAQDARKAHKLSIADIATETNLPAVQVRRAFEVNAESRAYLDVLIGVCEAVGLKLRVTVEPR